MMMQSTQASKVTRDYVLAMSKPVADEAPLLSVYGGRLTTYRKLAESGFATAKTLFSTHEGGMDG